MNKTNEIKRMNHDLKNLLLMKKESFSNNAMKIIYGESNNSYMICIYYQNRHIFIGDNKGETFKISFFYWLWSQIRPNESLKRVQKLTKL